MPAVTAASLDAYFHRKGSPFAGHGAAFIQAGKRYGFDPRLLVAISGAESSLGKHAQGHNPFGWGPGIQFGSWGQAIDRVGRGLKELYLSKGLTTVEQIQQKWAPLHVANDPTGLNSNWTKNVRAYLAELGGAGGAPAASGSPSPRTPTTEAATISAGPDLAGLASSQLQEAGSGKRFDAVSNLSGLVNEVRSTPPATSDEAALPGVEQAPAPDGQLGKVVFGSGADRAGVHTKQPVILFARRVAAMYGMPLTIGTGTNHSHMTVNGNVSDHWDGNAVDIPATGAKLIRLGRLALIAAGMPRKQAMKQKGGLYNVGGHQIIFATREGGNHFNHVHLSAH